MEECSAMQQEECRDHFKEIHRELRLIDEKIDQLRSANGLAGRVVILEQRAATYGRRWGFLGGMAAAVVINILTYLLIYGELAKAIAKATGN